MKNWGGNITYSTDRLHETTAGTGAIVRNAARVRALGTRHSFNRIGDTRGELISLPQHNASPYWHDTTRIVQIEPGMTFGELGAFLHPHGYTLTNYPSLPHVGVVGAVQTGTHGSGTQNVSADVVEMEFIDGRGDVRSISLRTEPGGFSGYVVGLGLLGVITSMSLRIRPTFTAQQDVYDNVPLEALTTAFDAVTRAAYSVSFFTDWHSDRLTQVWFKYNIDTPPQHFSFLHGRRSQSKRHPIAGVDPSNCTEQGLPGPAHERLPHFRHDREPSSAGHELQAEYFVARSDAAAALRAIASIGPALRDVLMISEVRTVLADELWLSPAYQRDSVAIHFTLQPDEPAVLDVLSNVIEPALAPFNPRPHWGKLFCLSPDRIRSAYPMLPRFRQLCKELDPAGKFHNDFADRYIFGTTP